MNQSTIIQQKFITQDPLKFLYDQKYVDLYFANFLEDKQQAQFPIDDGYPIISLQCKSQKCYQFIKKQQFDKSIIGMLCVGVGYNCQQCHAKWNINNIIYDIQLQSLYNRNFTIDEKETLKTVIISHDFKIIVEKQKNWHKLLKKVNQSSIKTISEKFQQFGNIIKNVSNNEERKKHTFVIETQKIYEKLSNILKDNNNILKDEIKKIQQFDSTNITDFVILIKSAGRYKIHRYVERKEIQNQSFDFIMLLQAGQNCHPLYDKAHKNVYIISASQNLYWSNFKDMVNFQRGGLDIKKLGKISRPRSQFIQQITNKLSQPAFQNQRPISYNSSIIIGDYLYIIGGRIVGIYQNQVYRINLKKIMNKQQQNYLELQQFCKLKEGRAMCAVTSINNKLIVSGGAGKIGENKGKNLSMFQIIDTDKPQKSQTFEIEQLCLCGHNMHPFDDENILIWNGSRDCNSSSKQKQNNILYVVNIIDKKIVFSYKFQNYPHLSFGIVGSIDRCLNKITSIKMHDDEKNYAILRIIKNGDKYQIPTLQTVKI